MIEDLPALDPGEADAALEEESPTVENDEARSMFLAWLNEHLAVVEVTGASKPVPWCPEWWKHPEVVARLRASWKASLQAEANAGEGYLDAESNWWLQHWDRHAAVIFDPANGPFRDCNSTDGHLGRRKGNTTTAIVTAAEPPGGVKLV